MSDNPYDPSPEIAYISPVRQAIAPAVSVAETIGPRYWAYFIDNVLALAWMIPLAKLVHDDYPGLQAIVFVSSYFVYFFLWEALTGRSIGKLLLGLVIVQWDGRRITWLQALTRTLLRLIELNPLIALPAAIAVLASKNRQRLGDRLAGTVVVKSWRWRSFLAEKYGS